MNIKELKQGEYQFIPAAKTKMNVRDIPKEPTPPVNLDAAWSKPKTYTDIGQGIQDTLAGSGAETLKRATAVPDNLKFSWKALGKGLLNPNTYIQSLKDTATLIHGLAQSARTDVAFVPKGVYNLAKDLITGEFGKEIDTAQHDPNFGDAGNPNASAFDKIAGAANAFNTGLARTAPLLGLVDMTESLPNNTNKIPGMNKVNSALENRYVKQNAKEWSAPVETNKPGYSKATDIFKEAEAKGNNIPETLTKNKIDINNNIENGKYSTLDTAEKIRTDAGKMSGEVLRPSLEKADHFTPKTPVEEVINSTIADIKKSKGITVLDEEAQIAKVQAQGEALARKYPEGMSLTDMHDNQINYAHNGGYNFGDTPETGNIKATNRAFGRTLNNLLEEKSPAGIPVKEFKTELSKQYQAADYLESLDKKAVPQTTLQYIAKTAAKVTGAAVGHGMGGGILGGVGGYHIGGMIESLFENMPNPVKAQFLNNLRTANPEAFAAVQKFMQETMNSQINNKQLPAPGSTRGSSYRNPPTNVDVGPMNMPTKIRPLETGTRARVETNPGRLLPEKSATPNIDPKTIRLPSKTQSTIDALELKNLRRVGGKFSRRYMKK